MGFVVEELVWDGNRVVGIRGRAPGGATVTDRSSLAISSSPEKGRHDFLQIVAC